MQDRPETEHLKRWVEDRYTIRTVFFMERAPSTMRTGTSELENPLLERLLTDDFMTKVYSVALAIIQSSMETAVQYAKAAGRDVVLTEDCVYGLKYRCRTFATAPDLEDRIRKMYDTMSSEIGDESEESDLESEPDSDQYDASEDSVEMVDESTLPPFERAPETDELAVNVHAMVDTWDDWEPTDPVEYMFKRAVENVYVSVAQTTFLKDGSDVQQNA